MKLWPFSKSAPKPAVAKRDVDTLAASSRSFAAAQVDRLIGQWTWDGGFSNGEIASALASIRARAREMAKNSEYFANWVRLNVTNIAGPSGFRLKSLAERSLDDVTLDKDAAFFIETHWMKWAGRRSYCDLAGFNSFASMIRLAVDNLARDGEAFIRIVKTDKNPYGVALQSIRPDCIDETLNHTISDTAIIRSGIEVDPRTWERRAYWLDTTRNDPLGIWIGDRRRFRVPADEMVHIFIQHDAQQVRGISPSHPFLRKLKFLDQFDEAELVAAKDEACSLGYFTAPAGREMEIVDLTDGEACAKLEQKKAPGSRVVLPPGWGYNNTSPQHPNAGLPAFKTSMLRDVASGGGVEFANFANDWAGVSYSSVRVGTISERDNWMVLQNEFCEKVVDPIFEAWLKAFLTYRISGGRYTINDFERLLPHEFRGRRWAWVDPMKDINASVIAVKNGFQTAANIAADNGVDIDDAIVEKARVEEECRRLGVMLGDVAPAVDKNPISEEE